MFAIVVDKVLLPDPARPCSQSMFWLLAGLFTQSTMNFNMPVRVSVKHSIRLDASIVTGFSLSSASWLSVQRDNVVDHQPQVSIIYALTVNIDISTSNVENRVGGI
jgi:hypothetical protein